MSRIVANRKLPSDHSIDQRVIVCHCVRHEGKAAREILPSHWVRESRRREPYRIEFGWGNDLNPPSLKGGFGFGPLLRFRHFSLLPSPPDQQDDRNRQAFPVASIIVSMPAATLVVEYHARKAQENASFAHSVPHCGFFPSFPASLYRGMRDELQARFLIFSA